MPKISYCGQVCIECPVYQATRENDHAQRIWLALEYSSADHHYQPEEMRCTGCHSSSTLAPMCKSCEIRECAIERVLISCAECQDYPCSIIERLVPIDTDNRAELECRRDYLCGYRSRIHEMQYLHLH